MLRLAITTLFVLILIPSFVLLADDDAKKKDSRVVELTIDFGDGFQKRYTSLAVKPKMTVFGVLKAAEKHARPIKITSRGKGETAFVTQIDDLKNEGSGRNWIFWVNGKLGKRSCDASPVKAGDKVEWKFSKYNP